MKRAYHRGLSVYQQSEKISGRGLHAELPNLTFLFVFTALGKQLIN